MNTCYALIEHVDKSSALLCIYQDRSDARRIALAQAGYRRAELRVIARNAGNPPSAADYVITKADTAKGSRITLVHRISGHVDLMSWDIDAYVPTPSSASADAPSADVHSASAGPS